MKTTAGSGNNGATRRKADDVETELLKEMDRLVPAGLYPEGVRPVPSGPSKDRIARTAFFPGGIGLYLECRNRAEAEFPFGGVMVLGHNFDCERNFNTSVANGVENLNGGAWAALLSMLPEAGVPRGECFFTNAFMGLCEGDNNRDFRGRDEQGFRDACLSFLKKQIETEMPRLILTLGLHVPPLLACASPDDLSAWAGVCKGVHCDPELHLKDLDAEPMILGARFHLGDGLTHEAVVVPLAHPSDGRNTRKRKPIGFSEGTCGEVELIRAGYAAAGFHDENQLPCVLREADRPTLRLNPKIITAAIQGCEVQKKRIEQRIVELGKLLSEGRTKH